MIGPDKKVKLVLSYPMSTGRNFAEILRAEGLNAFNVTDISTIDAAVLADYDVVILGEMGLSAAQVTLLSDWVNAGGNLVAMRACTLTIKDGLLHVTSTGNDPHFKWTPDQPLRADGLTVDQLIDRLCAPLR